MGIDPLGIKNHRPMRADARRNFERLVGAAHEALAEDGPEASLDDIARRAGVGIGTLYRHFPSREMLIEAVLSDQHGMIHREAQRLLATRDPGEAAWIWFRTVLDHAMTFRGVAASVQIKAVDCDPDRATSCYLMQHDGETLVKRAQEAEAIRPGVTWSDVSRLLNGVALSIEHAPDRARCADRLFAVIVDGLSTQTQ